MDPSLISGLQHLPDAGNHMVTSGVLAKVVEDFIRLGSLFFQNRRKAKFSEFRKREVRGTCWFGEQKVRIPSGRTVCCQLLFDAYQNQ